MRGQFPAIICFKYFPRIKSFHSLIFNSAFCHILPVDSSMLRTSGESLYRQEELLLLAL